MAGQPLDRHVDRLEQRQAPPVGTLEPRPVELALGAHREQQLDVLPECVRRDTKHDVQLGVPATVRGPARRSDFAPREHPRGQAVETDRAAVGAYGTVRAEFDQERRSRQPRRLLAAGQNEQRDAEPRMGHRHELSPATRQAVPPVYSCPPGAPHLPARGRGRRTPEFTSSTTNDSPLFERVGEALRFGPPPASRSGIGLRVRWLARRCSGAACGGSSIS